MLYKILSVALHPSVSRILLVQENIVNQNVLLLILPFQNNNNNKYHKWNKNNKSKTQNFAVEQSEISPHSPQAIYPVFTSSIQLGWKKKKKRSERKEKKENNERNQCTTSQTSRRTQNCGSRSFIYLLFTYHIVCFWDRPPERKAQNWVTLCSKFPGKLKTHHLDPLLQPRKVVS